MGFYSVIGGATLLGVVNRLVPIDPMRALFLSAVTNGVIAAPMMAVMMIAVSLRKIVGEFKPPLAITVLGWGATAAMTAVPVALVFASAGYRTFIR